MGETKSTDLTLDIAAAVVRMVELAKSTRDSGPVLEEVRRSVAGFRHKVGANGHALRVALDALSRALKSRAMSCAAGGFQAAAQSLGPAAEEVKQIRMRMPRA